MLISRLSILLISIVMLGGMSCTSSSRKLVWSDEFEYSGQPDSSFWNYELGNGCPNLCGWGNGEEQFYTQDLANVRVENGRLIIEAIKGDSLWTSARLTTSDKINFTYGRIEFRAKLPTGVGTWPALWMLSEQAATIGWPACGEIDVMEHVGRNPGVIQSALHSQSSFGNTFNKGETTVSNFETEFHIYGANWFEDKIQFFVDDQVFYTYHPKTENDDTWPFKSPFFIIINIAMGGGLGGPIDPDLSHARMEIDYIRFYN